MTTLFGMGEISLQMTRETKRPGRRSNSARSVGVLLCASLAVVLLASPASAQDQDIVVVTQCIEGYEGWLGDWMVALDEQAGYRARFGHNLPFETASDLSSAEGPFKEGQANYLSGDYARSGESFEASYEAFGRLLEQQPFCDACYDGAVRSGFYWITGLLNEGDKGKARTVLDAVLERFPEAEPPPGLFPPTLTRFVKDAQKGSRGRKGSLVVNVRPEAARVAVNGKVLPQSGGEARAREIPTGVYRVAVGAPGLGTAIKELDVSQGTVAEVDLLGAAGDFESECGRPAGDDAIYVANRLGWTVRYLIVATDAASIGEEGSIAWLHTLPSGKLTAAVLIPRGTSSLSGPDARRVAEQTIVALGTEEVESLEMSGGELLLDDGLERAVSSLLKTRGAPALEDLTPDSPRGAIRLGLSVAAGAGLVSDAETEEPGFADSLFVIRPDIAYQVADAWDVGLMVRAQVPDTLFMAQPYVRYRMPDLYVNLRLGAGLGQVGQTVRLTTADKGDEHGRLVTQGLFGPALGLELQFGPVVIGADVIAPLFPDTTVQIDLALGASFDI